MSQVEIGKKVNKIEGHEREAKEDTYPFLTAFALRKEKHKDRCENFLIKWPVQSSASELEMTSYDPKSKVQRLVN